jgi:hypothetical protein
VSGFLQAWANRFAIDPDGVNYLDIARAYFRGDWKMALNSYWSPLYSWVLGFVLHLFKPPPYWESTVIHVVNFAIFLLALRSFEFFLAAVSRCQRGTPPARFLGRLCRSGPGGCWATRFFSSRLW